MNWNRYPRVAHEETHCLFSRFDPLLTSKKYIIPYGNRKSYSDCCLNENNIVLSTNKLNRFIAFDTEKGILTCESGVTLAEILSICVPKKWFLSVLPGTQHVTLGGAIANDIHGKNHLRAGSFGCHVLAFELLRSDGSRIVCSTNENQELYHASIGGLGLTGVIITATIQLKPIDNPYLTVYRRIFHSLASFFEINAEATNHHEYTVAWIDPYHERGEYIAADHLQAKDIIEKMGKSVSSSNDWMRAFPQLSLGLKAGMTAPATRNLPIIGHALFFNNASISLFNKLHFWRAQHKPKTSIENYYAFFFPLDNIKNWNKLYGRRGFLQYQCVLPTQEGFDSVKTFLHAVRSANRKSSLMVLKTFGDTLSKGLLSFPKAGITIAMDFASPDRELLKLFDTFDRIVMDYQGRVNPAKDARMSPTAFHAFFPNWKTFANVIDPQFSSNFWRRVTA